MNTNKWLSFQLKIDIRIFFSWFYNIIMQENRVELRGIKIFPFTSEKSLLDYIEQYKGILVAINAEKIIHATMETRLLINRNIGYWMVLVL